MRTITLNRAEADNLGHFCDAGSVLTIGEEAERHMITADRAQQLLDSHGAEESSPSSSKSRAKKPTKAPAKKRAAKKPAPNPDPAPVPPASEPAVPADDTSNAD